MSMQEQPVVSKPTADDIIYQIERGNPDDFKFLNDTELFLEEKEDGSGVQLTDIGQEILRKLPDTSLVALVVARRGVAGMMKVAGLEMAKADSPRAGRIEPSSSIDYARLNKVLEANPRYAGALLGKAALSAVDVAEANDQLLKWRGAHPGEVADPAAHVELKPIFRQEDLGAAQGQ